MKKKENLTKKKPIIEEKKQSKLTNWLQFEIDDKKDKYEYENDKKDEKLNYENGEKKNREKENVKESIRRKNKRK